MDKTKICLGCGEKKTLGNFHKRKDGAGGLNARCKECILAPRRGENGTSRRYYDTHKKEFLRKSAEYQKSKKGREAHRKAGLKYNQSHKQETHDRHILRKYGLLPGEHEKLYVGQNGCCALCGKTVAYNRVSTDHDHETGKVRGLLCQGCNTGIGLLGDNIEGLQRAIEYLRAAG